MKKRKKIATKAKVIAIKERKKNKTYNSNNNKQTRREGRPQIYFKNKKKSPQVM